MNHQPPKPSSSDRLRGLGALVTTLLLLFGVPFLLARFGGWPLPHAVPSVGEVTRGLTRDLDIGHVVKALFVFCWLTWAVLAWALARELLALRTGRSPQHRRSIGSIQLFAARLVSGITLIISVPGVASAAPLGPLPQRAAPIEAVRVADAPAVATAAQVSAAPVVTERSTQDAAVGSIIVQPRDTLHRLAEVHLGDAMRWREIWDLNGGNTMADGSMFSRPEMIRPGWVLAIPGHPVDLPTIEVAIGDSLSSLAASHLGSPDRWVEIWSLNANRTFGDRVFDNPDIIQRGWTLRIPIVSASFAAPAAPEPTVEPAAPTAVAPTADVVTTPALPTPLPAPTPVPLPPAVPASTSTSTSSLGPAPSAQPTAPSPSSPTKVTMGRDATAPTALGLAGATMLAGGLLTVAAARRRRRLRSMGPEHSLPAPDPTAIAVLRTAAETADALMTERLGRLVRLLANDARVDLAGSTAVVFDSASDGSPARGTPRAVAFRVGDQGDITVHFDRPATRLVEPLVATGDPTVARVPMAVALPVGDLAPVTPALVMIGTVGDDTLYLDLEMTGGLVVDGEELAAASVLRALVATLSLSPFATDLDVLVHGVDLGAFSAERRIELAASPTAMVAEARALTSGRRDEDDTAPPSARRLDDSLPVCVVAAGRSVPADTLIELTGRPGVCVVTDVASVVGPWHLVAGRDGWTLPSLGLTVVPVGLTIDDVNRMAHTLADAAAPPLLLPPQMTVSSPALFVDRDWTLLVRLLGSVDVVSRSGASVDFEKSKGLELVAWLAEHRVSPLRSLARSALWDSPIRDATFHNVASDARRSMARLVAPPDGEDWVARNDDRIALHQCVVSDAELVRARLEQSRVLAPSAAIEVLRPALSLVRDLPLVGTDYLWADAEGIASSLTHLSLSVCIATARHALTTGDLELVFAATSTGLRVLPGHDDLLCLRMEAHAAQGNAAAVRSEYAGYERSITADPFFDGEPSPRVASTRVRLLAELAGTLAPPIAVPMSAPLRVVS